MYVCVLWYLSEWCAYVLYVCSHICMSDVHMCVCWYVWCTCVCACGGLGLTLASSCIALIIYWNRSLSVKPRAADRSNLTRQPWSEHFLSLPSGTRSAQVLFYLGSEHTKFLVFMLAWQVLFLLNHTWLSNHVSDRVLKALRWENGWTVMYWYDRVLYADE